MAGTFHDEGPMSEDPGPRETNRETALSILTRLAEVHRRKLAGLEALLRVVEKVESASPLEEMLWEMVRRLR